MPAEGEAVEDEIQNKGEGEIKPSGCCNSSGKSLPKDLFQRTLGDWRIIEMTLMALTALTYFVKK